MVNIILRYHRYDMHYYNWLRTRNLSVSVPGRRRPAGRIIGPVTGTSDLQSHGHAGGPSDRPRPVGAGTRGWDSDRESVFRTDSKLLEISLLKLNFGSLAQADSESCYHSKSESQCSIRRPGR